MFDEVQHEIVRTLTNIDRTLASIDLRIAAIAPGKLSAILDDVLSTTKAVRAISEYFAQLAQQGKQT